MNGQPVDTDVASNTLLVDLIRNTLCLTGMHGGHCTPGMLMSAAVLLAHTPRPSEAQIVHAPEGNQRRAGAECAHEPAASPSVNPYVSVLQTYMRALDQSDYATVKGLFAPGAKVRSPFLGEMPAAPFFDRLAAASTKNVITPIDIFVSTTEQHHATAYFQYDWTVRDGTLITFKVMDLFTFEPGSREVTYLDLIYDTHPIRASAGNKYET